MVGFMLLALARCADPAVCPTDAELLAAVQSADAQVVMEAQAREQATNPDSLILMSPQRIRRISDVYCDEPWPAEAAATSAIVHCKFTVKYWSADAYTVARLVRLPEGWRIETQLLVTRSRR